MIQNALVFDNYKVTLRGKKKKEVTDIRINQIFLLGKAQKKICIWSAWPNGGGGGVNPISGVTKSIFWKCLPNYVHYKIVK